MLPVSKPPTKRKRLIIIGVACLFILVRAVVMAWLMLFRDDAKTDMATTRSQDSEK